jgi:hypothetical protein
VPDDHPAAAFLAAQIDALQPFEFIVVGVPLTMFDGIEVAREENGSLRVRLGPRPPAVPISDTQRVALEAAGFRAHPSEWTSANGWELERDLPDGAAAAAVSLAALSGVFGVAPGQPVDLHHGTRRAEHEAHVRMGEVQRRLVPMLTEMLGHEPETDADGDYPFVVNGVQIFVAPRVVPGPVIVVRVFAITNIGVELTPDIGLFLARLNFGMVIGRFALDVEHQAVWFDETVLGPDVTADELRFVIEAVASTAAEWDDRIKQQFGGITRTEMLDAQAAAPNPPPKPGEGGYL